MNVVKVSTFVIQHENDVLDLIRMELDDGSVELKSFVRSKAFTYHEGMRDHAFCFSKNVDYIIELENLKERILLCEQS
jgi:hypothetical protein